MSKRIVLHFPHNPYPPRTGDHHRGLQILRGLKSLGCEITLTSSTHDSDNPWTSESINYLEENLVNKVHIFEPNTYDQKYLKQMYGYYSRRNRKAPIDSRIHTPGGMRQWFESIIQSENPYAVWMTYAYWDKLINHKSLKSVERIIDSLVVISMNIEMWGLVRTQLPAYPIGADKIKDEVIDENFYNQLSFHGSRKEFSIYDQYDITVSINKTEARIFKENTHRTEVVYIPMTMPVSKKKNKYIGSAIFPTGPNPFNVQGYFYFLKKVLPLVRREAIDFSLNVTGFCSPETVEGADGIHLSGFIPDYIETLLESRFMICPVWGGTGQFIKVIEGMAFGLPAIVLQQAANRTPIQHGINGYIAKNSNEFAEFTIQLWKDQTLCKKLGKAAKETIKAEYSEDILTSALEKILRLESHP